MARTTIKDIALAAGVSITTVSHALNGTRYVSPKTRARIQELARIMEYRPDPIARMLQGQDSLLIGHILSGLASNPFFGLVASGADRRAQDAGYATLLSYTDCHAESERRAVDLLLEKRVNGIIFTTPQSAANVERAVSAGVATVMIERPLPVRGAHAVVIDHRRGLRDLTRVLIAQGHRRLAYIGGDFCRQGSDLVERQRLRGFRDAVSEAGLALPSTHILLVPYCVAPARAACQALLDAGQRPTALVIGSDLLAAGVFQVLYERRLRVPDDLAVVSYDNTLGPYMAPPLTEAEPPTEEMGRQAVDLIVEECQRSAARGRGRGQRVVLQARLHLRDSARPLDDPLVTRAISSQEGALGG
jgi:DNA-binding LacI/PurR family transcriptional regulator